MLEVGRTLLLRDAPQSKAPSTTDGVEVQEVCYF